MAVLLELRAVCRQWKSGKSLFSARKRGKREGLFLFSLLESFSEHVLSLGHIIHLRATFLAFSRSSLLLSPDKGREKRCAESMHGRCVLGKSEGRERERLKLSGTPGGSREFNIVS